MRAQRKPSTTLLSVMKALTLVDVSLRLALHPRPQPGMFGEWKRGLTEVSW